jgi:lipoprotein-anchoring transpeptidase ErfK/SrfK
MLGRMVSGTETLSWSRWVAVGARLKPIALVLAGVAFAVGAWFVGQVVVLDHTSALLLDSSLGLVRAPVRPETPIRITLQGAGAELGDAQLYRSEAGAKPPSEQPVPIQLLPEQSGTWRLVAPDGGSALITDGDYRLVVHVVGPRPALPTPRIELVERQYRFSTVASPRLDVPTEVVHPRWAEPVAFSWSLPMQSVSTSVEPSVPFRTWIDQREPKRTWVQVGGDGGAGLVDGQTYSVQVTDGVSTDGLALRKPSSFRIGVPTRPRFVDPPGEPVTLQYGESLTLTATANLSNTQIDMSEDAPARASVKGSQVVIDMPEYQQGADFDVTIGSATSPEGAPLQEPVTVHIQTPEALPAPSITPADGDRFVLPFSHPSISFSEPVADPEAASQALQIQPPIPGSWQWTAPDRVEFIPNARLPVLTDFRITLKGGPNGPRTAEGGFLEQDILTAFRTAHDKKIDISLGMQRLTMIEDGVALRTIAVATGVALAPTPVGNFFVQYKSPQMRFSGWNPDGSHYDIPDVHWVMPFLGDYTLHGAYWRPRFGVPGSDGCVSMTDVDAKVLYDWADVGTPVNIHQ